MKWGVRNGPPYPINKKKESVLKNQFEINRKISIGKKNVSKYSSKPLKISPKERTRIEHEIMTWIKKEDRWRDKILSKPIGKFVYVIRNFGDGTFQVVSKTQNNDERR